MNVWDIPLRKSIKGGISFLEDAVVLGGAFGHEIAWKLWILKQAKYTTILFLRRLLNINLADKNKLPIGLIADE